jgi:integrase
MSVKKIKRRGKTVYQMQFTHKYPDGTRRQFRLDSGRDTKKEAEEYERQVRRELDAGTYKNKQGVRREECAAIREEEQKRKEEEARLKAEKARVMTFRKFARVFMKNFAEVENKPSEQENKNKWLRNNLLPYFGDMPLKDIGTKEADAFKARLREEEYSIHSVNNCLAVLKKMLSVAVDWKEIESVPKIKNLKRGEEKPPFFLLVEQAKALVANIEDHVLRAMVIFALHTGLRIGELRALHWADLDFKAMRLVVRRNIWKGKIGSPKGNRSREIPLVSEALKALQSIPRSLDANRPVFCHADGSYFDHNQGYSPLRTAAKRAGITHPEEGKQVGFHTLRHTFASHLAMKRVPQKAIKELLGHASLDMTDKYMHLSPDFKDDSVAVLDGLFGVAS